MTRNRDYQKEYAQFHSRPEEIKKRGMRVQARRDMEKVVGAKALDGKDVHHRTPLRSGGGNGKGNLAITSTKHRAWNRGS
jgi:hypothetical protein